MPIVTLNLKWLFFERQPYKVASYEIVWPGSHTAFLLFLLDGTWTLSCGPNSRSFDLFTECRWTHTHTPTYHACSNADFTDFVPDKKCCTLLRLGLKKLTVGVLHSACCVSPESSGRAICLYRSVSFSDKEDHHPPPPTPPIHAHTDLFSFSLPNNMFTLSS